MEKKDVIDANSEQGKELNRLHELDRSIRGAFLIQAVSVEFLVGNIITQHFCTDEKKRMLLFSLIINGADLTFSSKIDIIHQLLGIEYPELAKKYPKLKEGLDKIRRIRNRLAHAVTDNSDEFMAKKYNDRIRLKFFEDGQTKYQEITVMESDERLAESSKIVNDLMEIDYYITAKQKPSS